MTIPLANRSADGRPLGARLKHEKLSLEQVLEVQPILTEARDAGSLTTTSQARMVPALRSLELDLQLEEAERLKYSPGDSSLSACFWSTNASEPRSTRPRS